MKNIALAFFIFVLISNTCFANSAIQNKNALKYISTHVIPKYKNREIKRFENRSVQYFALYNSINSYTESIESIKSKANKLISCSLRINSHIALLMTFDKILLFIDYKKMEDYKQMILPIAKELSSKGYSKGFLYESIYQSYHKGNKAKALNLLEKGINANGDSVTIAMIKHRTRRLSR